LRKHRGDSPFPSIARCKEAKLAAGYDINPATVEAAVQGVLNSPSPTIETCTKAKLDAVVIATEQRTESSVAAAQAGIHVVVEKPRGNER
jgi:predicted dehydrogenase